MKRVLLVWVLLVVSVTCFCQGGGILGYKMTDVKFGNNYSSTTSKVNFVNKGPGVYTIDGISRDGKEDVFSATLQYVGMFEGEYKYKGILAYKLELYSNVVVYTPHKLSTYTTVGNDLPSKNMIEFYIYEKNGLGDVSFKTIFQLTFPHY